MEYQFDSFGNLIDLTPQELEAIESDSDAVIVLNCGIASDGKPYWAYIAIQPSRYGEYIRAARAHETITFSDYGTILQYGFDKKVPATVQERMKQRYGYDQTFREQLAKDINQAREVFLKQRNGKITAILNNLKHKNADN